MPVMVPPSAEPRTPFRPRDPQGSELWLVIVERFETFRQVHDERFQANYGYSQRVTRQALEVLSRTATPHALILPTFSG